ncbi:MAG: hypothetical protein A2358_03585 [Candidatus Staskawiczbacteria bacterium RIFOXYB1_FULL_37_44]|uniref:FAD-dependent oxidoreductase n=1 Tax=Candidatus Staskawiczbacteria bacterium RIFOXYB1_FULL_37_44 TaxID=1802223 RepID=A0A1G2IXF8_9BACT|nr:MAG: hypothetical protein A2358_03585 [Candidatus Staskawiczbacteria bacterium RIFOXYB1_FULL_37_44]OGZ84361.1 MAG: hypothetical protein A2416_01755 [Candidatus Staskawiczbacteria bacterium RIFOXYC1_FULL_37_52]OGZ89793.1 MAG: hypothetical protein A2581_00925 [Candidatus Staskawiczbacteria bacterium RIFOXYD1_FULL_37_110]
MPEKDTKFSAQGGPASGWDVAIIGGGPAGIMSAIQSAANGFNVVLIEKNKQLGKKFLLTGNGRCNLTNAELDLKKLVANYHNGEFLYRAFSPPAGGFGPKETIKFFEDLGIKTKTEAGNRVFPENNSAEEILEALKKYLEKNKVKIIYDSAAEGFELKNKKILKIILNNNKKITAKKYILTTGGKSYAKSGSDGAGYKLAEKLGHSIIKPSPALTPIILKEDWVKKLQGISLKNIKIFGESGEILFTHFGISGPVALNISGKIGELLKKNEVKIFMDLFPELNQQEILENFQELLKKYLRQAIKNILTEFVPERFAEVLLEIIKIDKNKIANNLSKSEKNIIVRALKGFEMTAEGVLGFDNAMATRGGISLKEINHKTMQSKLIDNLFFAGEIIDVDGKTGGFNLQMCWSTGHLASMQ